MEKPVVQWKNWHNMRKYSFDYLSSERQTTMGFAILWVMFFHSTGNYGNFPVLAKIKSFGNLGVDIFLLLSGIGLYFSAQRLSQETGGRWIVPFYRKRFLRILPATIFCLFPWYCYLNWGQRVNIFRFILDVTSLSYWIDGNNQGWYVALTIVLYLFYPLFYTVIIKGKRKAPFYCFVLIAIDISINTIIAIFQPDWFGRVNLAICRVPMFIAGCFLGVKVKEKKEQNLLPIICFPFIVVFVVILLKYKEPLRVYGIWRYLTGALGFCVAVVLSAVFRFVHGRWISKFFCFFGKYTLELYLVHTQILAVLEKHMKPNLSVVLINMLAVGFSLTAAIIVHEGLSLVLKRFGEQ